MASSSYYKGKIDEFNELKAQLSSLLGKIDTSVSTVKKSKEYLDGIIICGEPIDKGVLGDNVLATIESITSTINNLISECGTKIAEYTELYYSAVEAEQREERRKKGVWSIWT